MSYSLETGTLDFKEARQALGKLYDASDEKRRYTLRILVLHAYNDKYGRKEGEEPSAKDVQFFKENCRELINMEQTTGTLKAELYRELGEWDMCLKVLDSLEPAGEYENGIREQIRSHAVMKDSVVFKISKE